MQMDEVVLELNHKIHQEEVTTWLFDKKTTVKPKKKERG
jgi:hypothetical protein